MSSKPRMTLEQHLEVAKHLAIAAKHLREVSDLISRHYPKNHKVTNAAINLDVAGWKVSHIHNLQCWLDSDFHAAITDEEYKELCNATDNGGHIYWWPPDNFDKLRQREAIRKAGE